MANDPTIQRRSTHLWTQLRLLTLFVTAAAALLHSALGQATKPAAPRADGERLLEDGRTTLEASTLTAARAIFEQCLHHDTNNAVCYYDLAQTDFYLGRAQEFQGHKQAAEQARDAAIDDVQHAISLNDQSSNAHALLADLYGAKISGMLSGMRYGPKANAETQRAFQLDPHNPQAFAVLGRKYLYAPTLFGGDIDKAINAFKQATTFDPQYDEAFVWLALAYRKKGDAQQSQAALTQALHLNSRSAFALRVQSGATN